MGEGSTGKRMECLKKSQGRSSYMVQAYRKDEYGKDDKSIYEGREGIFGKVDTKGKIGYI